MMPADWQSGEHLWVVTARELVNETKPVFSAGGGGR